jgi:hypothetical protein
LILLPAEAHAGATGLNIATIVIAGDQSIIAATTVAATATTMSTTGQCLNSGRTPPISQDCGRRGADAADSQRTLPGAIPSLVSRGFLRPAAVFGGVVTAAGLGLAAASGRALEANLAVGAITGYLLFVLLNVLAGVALGALLQSSATAIAASFALPAALAALGRASTLVSEWIDMSTTWNWVLEGNWGGHMPQISFSIVFWVAVPLAAGVVRTVRRDIT